MTITKFPEDRICHFIVTSIFRRFGLKCLNPATTAEPIEMLFGLWTRVTSPRKHVWGVALAQPGEYDSTIHVRLPCGLFKNYFDHLFYIIESQIAMDPHQFSADSLFLTGKRHRPVKAKFHYASWFEAGRRQVRSWSATSFEPASNQIA